jgi:hypothetical protein
VVRAQYRLLAAMGGKMRTLLLTTPELEQAARQWAADFLHEPWGTIPVATGCQQVQDTACEDRDIVVFERVSADVLKQVLQNGGRPWLVSSIVNHGSASMHYRM